MVYFLPFLVLVLCYTLIFIKLLCREHEQQHGFSSRSSSSSCCAWLCKEKIVHWTPSMKQKAEAKSSFSEHYLQQKRVNTFARARSKTFRMVRLSAARDALFIDDV